MNIEKWPFVSITNKLQVELASEVQSDKGNDCKSTESNNDTSNNLRSIKIALNGAVLYPYF